MAKKMKFKPEVTRIRLNPEQAITICMCYNVGRSQTLRSCSGKQTTVCESEGKATLTSYYGTSAASS